MQFLTGLTAIMSEVYLRDFEDVCRKNETFVLHNFSSSFSSELHDLLLGCSSSRIEALETLLGRAFLLQTQHYFALPKT